MGESFKVGDTLTNAHGDVIIVVENNHTVMEGRFRAIILQSNITDEFVGREIHPHPDDIMWSELKTRVRLDKTVAFKKGDLVEDRHHPYITFMVIGVTGTQVKCVELATGEIYEYPANGLSATVGVFVGKEGA